METPWIDAFIENWRWILLIAMLLLPAKSSPTAFPATSASEDPCAKRYDWLWLCDSPSWSIWYSLPRTRYRAHRDPQNKPQSFSEWCPDTRWIKPPSCRSSSLADSLHPLPSSTIAKSIACQYIVPTRSSVILDSQTVLQSIPLDIPLE